MGAASGATAETVATGVAKGPGCAEPVVVEAFVAVAVAVGVAAGDGADGNGFGETVASATEVVVTVCDGLRPEQPQSTLSASSAGIENRIGTVVFSIGGVEPASDD